MLHHHAYSLRSHNTLKIDVQCDDYYLIESGQDISSLVNDVAVREGRVLVIGQGANILFTRDYNGTIVQLASQGLRVLEENDDSVLLEVDAGMKWHDLVVYAVDNNWGGIENMALIPGYVGAAPVGNIGAYGQSFSDVCDGLFAFEIASGKVVAFTAEECMFAYRDSIFKNELHNQYIVLSVRMRLTKNPQANTEYWSKKHGSVGGALERYGSGPYTIRDVMCAIIDLRTAKFPDMQTHGTAGSFFKNPVVSRETFERLSTRIPGIQHYPVKGLRYTNDSDDSIDDYVKVPAGDILDNGMGYSGLWQGNVGLFEKHALVLVTNGHATGGEVDAFATRIQKDFEAYCGVPLEREVITL